MALNTDEDTEPIVQAPSSVYARKGVGVARLGLAVGFVYYERSHDLGVSRPLPHGRGVSSVYLQEET